MSRRCRSWVLDGSWMQKYVCSIITGAHVNVYQWEGLGDVLKTDFRGLSGPTEHVHNPPSAYESNERDI